MNEKVVYTFIFGDYDSLKTPKVITPGWDYICFTDNPDLKSNVWQIRLSQQGPEERELGRKKFAMKHMILFHKYLEGYRTSLSIGGQMLVNCNIDNFLLQNWNKNTDLMITKHPWRNCIYDEGKECIRLGKDSSQRINTHMERYRRENYPRNNGLYATAIIARHHGRPQLNKMCELWFSELKNGSKRDQLSLNYALWKYPSLTVSEIDWNKTYTINKSFIINPHKHGW